MTSHLTVPVCEKGEIEECGALFFVTVEEARGDERAPQQGPHSPPRVHQPGRARHLSSSRSGCAQPMKTVLSAFSPISETSKTREVTHMANQLAGWRGSPRGDTRGTKKVRSDARRDSACEAAPVFSAHGVTNWRSRRGSPASEAVRVSFRVRGRQKIIKQFVSGRRSWRH